ncbi:hypothetical protein RHMOL_Rhmol02G0186900 [Rhododendron molle]|uniref:Uncharacterized protein n=1 Tax=Rhododendron molle TaxID=49168 RepID=A0ACC0PTF6_RHOML|nr:hypothetical protein RHMOL_Rhmol02G0186900 [Rhododendron molle]
MDSPIMLLCTYGLSTFVVKVSFSMNFDDLVSNLCTKWKNLTSSLTRLLYSLGGHSKCMLESQSDFENILILVCPLGLDKVDLIVSREGSNLEDDEENDEHFGVGTMCISSRVGVSEWTSGLEIESKFLGKYPSSSSTDLLSVDWVNLIREVGQVFSRTCG